MNMQQWHRQQTELGSLLRKTHLCCDPKLNPPLLLRPEQALELQVDTLELVSTMVGEGHSPAVVGLLPTQLALPQCCTLNFVKGLRRGLRRKQLRIICMATYGSADESSDAVVTHTSVRSPGCGLTYNSHTVLPGLCGNVKPLEGAGQALERALQLDLPRWAQTADGSLHMASPTETQPADASAGAARVCGFLDRPAVGWLHRPRASGTMSSSP